MTPASPKRALVFSALLTIVCLGLAAREISSLALHFGLHAALPDPDPVPGTTPTSAWTFAAAQLALAFGVLTTYIGTMLYACAFYVVAVFVRPSISPAWAASTAAAACWLVEIFQLTGVPAQLARQDPIAALALGSRFDWLDMAAYAAGAASIGALHRLLIRPAPAAAPAPIAPESIDSDGIAVYN